MRTEPLAQRFWSTVACSFGAAILPANFAGLDMRMPEIFAGTGVDRPGGRSHLTGIRGRGVRGRTGRNHPLAMD